MAESRERFINFHGIGIAPPGIEKAELDYWWDADPFFAALDKVSTAASDYPVLITFDDGNESDLDIALPALLERNLTASFFVCAGRVGTRGYLNASAIRRLLQEGMRIGSHGMHHLDWSKLDDTRLHIETVDAKRKLEDICGCEIGEVSIPFGRYDRRVLKKLKAEGYGRVYTSGRGIATREAWLKPRNTLDRSWQWKDIPKDLALQDSYLRRLRSSLSHARKSVW